MNSLNSIIIEGDVLGSVQSDGTPRVASVDGVDNSSGGVIFSIISTRNHVPLMVPIMATGRLADTCMEVLTAGRGVRVVGRLIGHSGLFAVYAEHIEFKPVAVKPIKKPVAVIDDSAIDDEIAADIAAIVSGK